MAAAVLPSMVLNFLAMFFLFLLYEFPFRRVTFRYGAIIPSGILFVNLLRRFSNYILTFGKVSAKFPRFLNETAGANRVPGPSGAQRRRFGGQTGLRHCKISPGAI